MPALKTLAAIDSAIHEKQDSIGVTESLPEKYLPEQKPDIPDHAENEEPDNQ